MLRLVAWLLTVGALVGSFSLIGSLKDPSDPVQQSYLSVPPLPLAQMVAGFRNLAADAWYLRFSSYWGYQLTHGRHFQNLAPILTLITDLDPKFMQAYELGSIALGDSGQVREAVALLDKGAKAQPDDYWYPYQAGLTLFFFSDDFMAAAHAFERAATKPNAPPSASYFAARMYEKGTRRDLAVQTWRRIYVEAKDSSMRQVAKNALKRFGVRAPGA